MKIQEDIDNVFKVYSMSIYKNVKRRRSSAFIVNFEHMSKNFSGFLSYLTLNISFILAPYLLALNTVLFSRNRNSSPKAR